MKKFILSTTALLFFLTVSQSAFAQPANDDFSGAITLIQSATCNPINGTTVGATQSIAPISCGGSTGWADDDVWYKFVATTATPNITVVGDSSFDAVVDLRIGGGNGTIYCSDTSVVGGGTETISTTGLTIGTTYYVRIYSYGANAVATGTFTICVSDGNNASVPPANDDCSGAITLVQQSNTYWNHNAGTTIGATSSISGTCSGDADDDVWYKFVATTSSPRIFVETPAGSSFDAVVELRSGVCNGANANISCTDTTHTGWIETIDATDLTIGSTYYVRVYSYGSSLNDAGMFDIFVIDATTVPPNDDCSAAILLTQTATCNPINGTTVGATNSFTGTCVGTADDDVWYQFVATTASPRITVFGVASFDAVLDLRSGGCYGTNIYCADGTDNGGTETINATGLTIGQTYYIRVYSFGASGDDAGTFTICVFSAPVPPSNDDCSGAILLTQTSTCTAINGTTVSATNSIPATCTYAADADDDVWYKFVATSTSPTIKVTGSSSFNAVLDLRSGGCTGTNLSCADAAYNGGTETINATGLIIGQTYYVRVYSYGAYASYAGTFTICVSDGNNAPVPPVNDDCSGAILLTQTATCTAINGTTVGSTQSMVAITCNGNIGSPDDVWYKFIATTATPRITVVGSSAFDAVLDLRSGGCNGTGINCATETNDGGTEIIKATDLTIGQTYYIRVYSYGSGVSSAGTFTICASDGPLSPPNDECSGSITLTQSATCNPINGTTEGATQSIAAISCGGGNSDDDVWYNFVATTATPTITMLGNSSFNAVVDLRSGGCNGTIINCADATINATGLVIGQTYYVRVYSFFYGASEAGTFTICVSDGNNVPAPPANDDCSAAFTLTQSATCTPINGTTIGATQSMVGTCAGTSDDDVWYKFVATTTTSIITVTGSSSFDAVLDLRSGACNGTNISCSDAIAFSGTETINANSLTIGQTYYVRVYSFYASESNEGTFTICVRGAPSPPANDNCSGAITLTQTATCTPINGTTINATNSIPSTYTGIADDDIWYQFVATSTSPTIKVTGSSSFNAVLNLRSGACNGTNINCVNVTGADGTETINAFGLTIGTTYYIRVYSYGSNAASAGTFAICVFGVNNVPLYPANDNCSGAITLIQTANCSPINGTTVGATQSMAAITCGMYTGGSDDDVWYKFVATSASPTIKVAGSSSFDAVLDLRSGGCNGTNIGCANVTGADGTVTFNASGLTIGVTYYIRIYSLASNAACCAGTFTICVSDGNNVPAPPANDDCSAAFTLTQSATCPPINGTTINATNSIPATCTGTADDDVWYQFVATSTSPTIKVTGSSSFDAVLDLRSGACNGTNISCANVTGADGTEIINASGLTVGTTYYVRVYSYGSNAASTGTFTICVSGVNNVPLSPANDDCSGAITLMQTPTCSPINGTTVGATQSMAAITCGGLAGSSDDDVWYQFVATSASPTITVVGLSSFDAVLDLRSGACNGVTQSLDCADMLSVGGSTEKIFATNLTIGTTYYVRVYSFGSGVSGTGTFTICVSGIPVPAPANDDCSGAITLIQAATCSPINGTTVGATQSMAASCAGTADDDVWYQFVATSATPTITVAGSSSFDAVVDLRSGACNGTNISCADATSTGGVETINTTSLTVGTTYYVRVYSYSSAVANAGTFTICVFGIPAPANDDCSGAITLIQASTTCIPTNGTTVNATNSIPGSCSGSADDDVWYKFVAITPTSIIKVLGFFSFDAVVNLRSGNCNGTNITCIDASAGGEAETIYASGLTVDSTYYVIVHSWGGNASSQGTFSICVYNQSMMATGMEEEAGISPDFTMYPNPVTNNLTLETIKSKTQQHFEIVNMVGQVLYALDVNNKTTIDLATLPKGVYMVKLFSGESIKIKKFIKQ